MRKMFILKGAPASGKSTLMKNLGLTDLAVGYDDARKLYSPILNTADLEGSRAIGRAGEKLVTEFVHNCIRHRVDMGATVFVDCTCVTRSAQKPFNEIASKAGYEVIIVDVQGDLTDEELLARNRKRGTEAVPDEVVIRMAANHRKNENFGNPRVISPSDIMDELTTKPEDFTGKKVIVVGDVQGCARQLNEMLVEEKTDDSIVVFAGDLFDRGPSNDGVMRTAASLGQQARFVMGNHDEHLYRVKSREFSPSRFSQTRETARQLANDGVSDKAIIKFLSRYVPVLIFTQGDEKYIVTHGGIDPGIIKETDSGYLTGVNADREYIIGSSHADNTYQYRGDYSSGTDERLSGYMENSGFTAQFHGHRNPDNIAADAFPGVYSLESAVEDGGYLTTAIIESGSVRVRYDD